jgi:hypothetical protein
MSKVSVVPDIEIRVYEADSTPRRVRTGFAIADMRGGLGGYPGYSDGI